MRPHLPVLVLVIMGGTACFTENTCGRGRSVSVHGITTQAPPPNNLVTVIMAEVDDRRFDEPPNSISWNIPVLLGGDPISAVHLHNRNAGHDDGVLYVFPQEGPEAEFILASSANYDYPTPMRILLGVARAGQAYLDIHTAAHPEGTARTDLTSVEYQDWTGYYCD